MPLDFPVLIKPPITQFAIGTVDFSEITQPFVVSGGELPGGNTGPPGPPGPLAVWPKAKDKQIKMKDVRHTGAPMYYYFFLEKSRKRNLA